MRVAMGDISAEPSMEEILSSIKRIIAEEGEAGQPRAARRAASPRPSAQPVQEPDEVLELREPMAAPRSSEPPRLAEPASRATEPIHFSPAPAESAPRPAEPIVSKAAAAASRGSLDSLSRLIVKPEGTAAAPQGDGTLEGMVREMLRPMLRDWLDARLPELVEAMVAREIERITGSR